MAMILCIIIGSYSFFSSKDVSSQGSVTSETIPPIDKLSKFDELTRFVKMASEQVESNAGNDSTVPEQGLYIIIDKSDYKLRLFDDGQQIREYDIAVGKNYGDKERPGDMKTPIGIFAVDEIIDSSYWTHDFGDGKGEIADAYGPWFISLATPWDGIGIHGTHDPSSIGTNVSEGCVRMYNNDLRELRERIVLDMSVEIKE